MMTDQTGSNEQWQPAIDGERWVRGAPQFPEGPQPSGHPRTVTFDLMAGDDTYFALTEALREFASRQRWEAEDDPTSTAQSRIRWAECAENALGLVEKAISLATSAGG